MTIDRALRAALARAGQEDLADHCDTLENAKHDELVRQIETLDLDLLDKLRSGEGLAGQRQGEVAPVGYVAASDRGPDTEASTRGRDALRAGKVAFALLAGGQASRLRWDGPKGTYPIGPRTERSLFQIFVERIVRAGRDFGALPPLCLTTSTATDAAVRTFFETNDCFGIDRDALSFARQASLPALDDEGKLILTTPSRIFRNPDGHGGAVTALETGGILKAWEKAGIEVVCMFQVDNPLLPVVDPDFIGRLLDGDAPIATKIVLKTDPAEKVGVVATVGGRPAIVEYSEISAEQARARDPDGQLTYRLGSIAVHAFDLTFLREALACGLPLHVARKEIPCVDASGEEALCAGIKYERFLFDLFPKADGITVVEVVREQEYAPLKNADGADSAESVRVQLDAQYRRWYAEAGTAPPEDEGRIELSPLDAIGPVDLGD